MKTYFIAFIFALISLFTQAQEINQPLTSLQMRRDLDIFKTSLTQFHPGVYRYNSRQQIDSIFTVAYTQTSTSLSYRDFYLLLSKIATRIKCAHTYLNPYNQSNIIKEQFYSNRTFPLLFSIIKERIYITENLSDVLLISKGDELLEINGRPVNQIIDSLKTYSRSDGNKGLSKKQANIMLTHKSIRPDEYSFFDIFFPLLFNSASAESVSIRLYAAGKKRAYSTSIQLLSKQQRWNKYLTLHPEAAKPAPFQYKTLTPTTAYLKIDNFETWQWGFDYKNYVDSLFRSVFSQTSINNFILDIRNNEGGDDEAATKVLSYFTNASIGCDTTFKRYYSFTSVADSLKPYLQTWDETFKQAKSPQQYIPQPDGSFYDTKYNYCNPVKAKSTFTGKTWLLTDGSNSSTTFFMVDLFQKNKIGRIVGQPTGGSKKGINAAEFFFLQLPESKLEIDIPLVYQTFGKNRNDEPIQPDFAVDTNPEDISRGIDTQIQFILTTSRK